MSLARRVSGHCPCSNQSILNKMTRLARRGLADKPPDTSGTSGTSAPSVVSGTSGTIEQSKKEMKKVLFSSEEKELMQTLDQKIPFTVEREPGRRSVDKEFLMRQFCILHWGEIITKVLPLCRLWIHRVCNIPPRNNILRLII